TYRASPVRPRRHRSHQKVELLAAHLLDGLDQGLLGGIWLDAPELLHLAMTKSRLHFGECSGLAGAFAAEQHQEASRGRYQRGKPRNRASASRVAHRFRRLPRFLGDELRRAVRLRIREWRERRAGL